MTKAMTEVRLKPCPFCGSEDFVLGFHEGHNEMRVKCKRCKTLFTIFDTPENAPKLWNRRTYCYQAERAVQDMTAEKAIEVLNEIGEGANIEDTLKNLSNSNTFTALKLAVHALEKKVPKKPIKSVIRYVQTYKCPFCLKTFYGKGVRNYCYHCGQAFDWSDEMESENNEKRDNS